MLNFINNKFRKIIISNIIVGRCFTNNIYSGYKDKNEDNEINKKKGYSGKNKNNEETITDPTENQDNNTNTNNNGSENINNKNLIKNKKEKLLRILEKIKKNNNYLSDKIEKQIINNLQTKIENINSVNTSNIENELNDLRNTINSKFDKIKENYINTVTNINNSIGILENYNKEKYKLKKYTLNIDEVNKTKFENIKDLNDTLEGIKKGYNDSINEIVKILKSEFDRLKNEKSNIKDKELDVKDEDFNNLTEATKIIDIDKKIFIYDSILKGNKTEIINKINPLYEKFEKCKELIKNSLKIEFVKENNLDSKNIDDLCSLYDDLSKLDIKLTDYSNKKKKELTEKYQNSYKIYENYKKKWKLEEINIIFDINNYNLDNYKDLENKIEEFEKNIKKNIDNLEQILNNEYKKIIKNYENKNLKYKKFSLKEINNLEEKYKYLEDLDKYLEDLKKSLKELEYELKFSVNTKILEKNELENYYKNIEELQKKLEKNKEYSESGIFTNETYNNYIEIGDNTEENLNTFIDKLYNIRLYCDIGVRKGKGDDYGAIRKQFYEESADFILNKLKIDGVKLIEKTKEDCLVFNTIDKNNKTKYNMFSTESKLKSYDYEKYIKLLALFCVNSLQNHDGCNTLFLNLNPLIYKIILNYYNLEYTKANDPKIKENLLNILNYDDLRYYDCNTWSYLLDRKEKDDDLDEHVEEIYNNMIENFTIQFPKIQKFYYYLKYYFKDDNFKKFNNFSKNDYWKLKYFLEGENIIKYDKLINCIDENTCLDKRFTDLNEEIISKNNAKKIYNIFLDILKNFSNEELLSFLRWSTGSKSLPIGKKIYFEFVKTLDYDHNVTLLSAHGCFYYFKIAINAFGLKDKNFREEISEEENEIIKKKLIEELKDNIKYNNFSIG